MRPRLSAFYTPTSWFNTRLILGADMSRTEAASLSSRATIQRGTAASL
jgi:hypothetical protein